MADSVDNNTAVLFNIITLSLLATILNVITPNPLVVESTC